MQDVAINKRDVNGYVSQRLHGGQPGEYPPHNQHLFFEAKNRELVRVLTAISQVESGLLRETSATNILKVDCPGRLEQSSDHPVNASHAAEPPFACRNGRL